jgi:hypothetical protein
MKNACTSINICLNPANQRQQYAVLNMAQLLMQSSKFYRSWLWSCSVLKVLPIGFLRKKIFISYRNLFQPISFADQLSESMRVLSRDETQRACFSSRGRCAPLSTGGVATDVLVKKKGERHEQNQ